MHFLIRSLPLLLLSLMSLPLVIADQRCPGVPDGGYCPFDPDRLDATVCCDLGFGPHCCNMTEFEHMNTIKFYILWGAVGAGLLLGCVVVPVCVVIMHISVTKVQRYWNTKSKNRRLHKSTAIPPRRPEPLDEDLYAPEPVDESASSHAIAAKTSPFYRKYSQLTDNEHTLETDLPSASSPNDTAYANQFYDVQAGADGKGLLERQKMLWRKSSFKQDQPH